MSRPTMRDRGTRTFIYLTIAILANSFGNLLLALAMERTPGLFQVGLAGFVWALIINPYFLPGATLTAIYSLVQLWLFSWADLSFVIPCVASSYIISTLLAAFVLGEEIVQVRWLGDLLICIGVILVAATPIDTKPHSGRARK